jgi:transposase InsO family protein
VRPRLSLQLAPRATVTIVLAESFNGFYKTESIRRKGLWCNVEHVEWAALNDVDLFNHRRIHESLDYVSSVEFEVHYHGSNESEKR